MPHVRVKIYKGHSEMAKQELAHRIAEQVIEVLGGVKESVSVAIEDVEPSEWKTRVYEDDIISQVSQGSGLNLRYDGYVAWAKRCPKFRPDPRSTRSQN